MLEMVGCCLPGTETGNSRAGCWIWIVVCVAQKPGNVRDGLVYLLVFLTQKTDNLCDGLIYLLVYLAQKAGN